MPLARILLTAAVALAALPVFAQEGEPARGSKDAAARRQSAAFQLEVDKAIDRGVHWLRQRQARDGSFTGGHFERYRSGPAALCAYAILQSGVKPADPAVATALRYLEAHPPTRTYSAGVTLMLLAELGLEEPSPLAEAMLEALIAWERRDRRGTWAYPDGGVDLSNVQFAALGLWAAHRQGLDVPVDLCRRVVEATAEHFQEPEREQSGSRAKGPEVASQEGRSRAGVPKVAGFRYGPEGGEPRASMTVAGVAVQRMMKLIQGRKLGAKSSRVAERSEALGMAWMEENLSFTKNEPIGGQHLLYYLWGVERLATFLERDELFGWDWYQEGARHLLAAQRGNGSWADSESETAFAILFLARATRGGRAASSGNATPESTTTPPGDLVVRVVPGWETTAWVESVAKDAHVARVEWLLDGEVIASVDGDPSQPWAGARFPLRHAFARQDRHVLIARALLVDPEAEPGEPGSLEDPDVIQCQPVTLDIAWEPLEWMARAAAATPVETVPMERVSFSASSEAGKDATLDRLSDGFQGTAWLAADDDPRPTLTVTFSRATKLEGIVLSHAAASVEAIQRHDGATRIRVVVDGDEEEAFEVALPDQSPTPIDVPLPDPGRLRSLVIEIVETAGGPGKARGWAEVVLR